MTWYRGDCHVHSAYSSGADLSAGQIAAEARRAGLDFLASTEHNTAAGHRQWDAHTDGLVVVLGQEVTTETGHWLALGIEPGQVVDWRYRVRDDVIDRHLDAVHRAGGLCVAAHPHAPYISGTFMYPYEGFDVVEVWNGPWTSDRPWQADNEAALAEWGRTLAAGVHRGRWIPAMGNSDAHLAGQIGTPHTVVRAEELSAAAVLDAIRAGRSWVAGSAAVDLSLTVAAGGRAAGIGDRLPTHGQPARLRLDVRGVPGGTARVHTDRGAAHRSPLPATGAGTVEWGTSARESAFVRVEVRHSDGTMAALTNPVVLG
ncbi:CehA/McbA family metallohydrolase [Pseudonocardia sichuanensis]